MPNRPFTLAILTLLLLALFTSAACSDPPQEGQTPDVGIDDTGEGDAIEDDAEDDVDDGTCAVQTDCSDDEYCFDGACSVAPSCSNASNWQGCVNAFTEIDESLGRRAYCDGSRCRIACLLDEECADGDICSDHGRCIPFTGEITGQHPGGEQAAPLRAGVANTLMHFPIGLSQGGYGTRAAANAGRYVESLSPTTGQMHGLYTRGIAVDDGTRQLIFLRAPIIFPSMALHEAVARNLQAHTGRDWRSSLAISGTHTHSGPARFWHIPHPETTSMPMGVLGIDEFHQRAFDWLVQSLTEAAMEALDDLAPAKMGWTIIESYDTDDRIASDRWSETPPFDDNRVLALRVDDLDDKPRALLISFGSHGTVHDGSYFTADVMVGMERQLENAIGKEYDTFAPVMYFNQNGGTMSPRGGHYGHNGMQKFDAIGHQLVEKIYADITTMDTTTDWSFDGYTHRFPLIYEHFGYEGHEFGAPFEQTRDGQYLFGGLMCSLHSGDGFDQHVHPEEYSCLGVHTLSFHRPISLFAKSQISAFQLNDLTLVTMPGELAMELGWQVQREIRDAYEIDVFKSFTWGYAQDHLLYLTPTNLRGERPPFPGISIPDGMAPDDYPDFAYSFLQGGYESQMSPWGHLLGDFLVDRAVEAVGFLLDQPIEPEFTVPLPDEFTYQETPLFPIDVTDPADVGTIVEQPPAQIERRQPFHFAWRGGDPGAEMPQAPLVTLERATNADSFETVFHTSRAPYTNREFLMLTRMRLGENDAWEWAVYWEELKDFPLGTYRFRVDGHYLASPAGKPVPYQTFSDPFDLVASTTMVFDEFDFLDAQTLSFRLSYPPAPTPGTRGPAEDRGRPSGSFRMHHPKVGTGIPIPVDADQDFDSLQATISTNSDSIPFTETIVTTNPEDIDGRSGLPVTRVELHLQTPLQPGQIGVEIEALDVYGNSGSTALTLEYTP